MPTGEAFSGRQARSTSSGTSNCSTGSLPDLERPTTPGLWPRRPLRAVGDRCDELSHGPRAARRASRARNASPSWLSAASPRWRSCSTRFTASEQVTTPGEQVQRSDPSAATRLVTAGLRLAGGPATAGDRVAGRCEHEAQQALAPAGEQVARRRGRGVVVGHRVVQDGHRVVRTWLPRTSRRTKTLRSDPGRDPVALV